MFNLGIGELTVIAIVLIIAVGPDRLPTLMKSLGKAIRTVRQTSRDLRTSVGFDELMRDDVLSQQRPLPKPPGKPPEGAVGRASEGAVGRASEGAVGRASEGAVGRASEGASGETAEGAASAAEPAVKDAAAAANAAIDAQFAHEQARDARGELARAPAEVDATTANAEPRPPSASPDAQSPSPAPGSDSKRPPGGGSGEERG